MATKLSRPVKRAANVARGTSLDFPEERIMTEPRTDAFTADNSDFTSEALPILNAVYNALLPLWQTDDGQGAKSLCDRLNNAWQDGNSVAELTQAAGATPLLVPFIFTTKGQSIDLDTALQYLDALRVSGRTNMFEATPYICQALKTDNANARTLLKYWMKTFSARHPRPAVTK